MKHFTATLESISAIRHEAKEDAKIIVPEVPIEVLDDVALATGEVATNVVKHCKEQIGDGVPVQIWFTQEDGVLLEHIKAESHCACAHRALIKTALECDPVKKAMDSVALGLEGGMGLSILGAITESREITPEGEMILAFAL